MEHCYFWNNFWVALGAAGSITASCVSLWLALRRPKERVSGEWEPLPFGGVTNCPNHIMLRLKNNGRTNVDLPDKLRVDFYMADTHWGETYASARINNFIPAKFYSYEAVVEIPTELLQDAVCDTDMHIFTWTKSGTRIELKRNDTKIDLENLGI